MIPTADDEKLSNCVKTVSKSNDPVWSTRMIVLLVRARSAMKTASSVDLRSSRRFWIRNRRRQRIELHLDLFDIGETDWMRRLNAFSFEKQRLCQPQTNNSVRSASSTAHPRSFSFSLSFCTFSSHFLRFVIASSSFSLSLSFVWLFHVLRFSAYAL